MFFHLQGVLLVDSEGVLQVVKLLVVILLFLGQCLVLPLECLVHGECVVALVLYPRVLVSLVQQGLAQGYGSLQQSILLWVVTPLLVQLEFELQVVVLLLF